MTKEEKIAAFDPNGLATGEQIYGLPFNASESEVIVLPVPWEVTVSYTPGTAAGPAAILEASAQVDLYDPMFPDAWKMGIWMAGIDKKLAKKSDKYRERAENYLEALATGELDAEAERMLKKINEACSEMVDWVKDTTTWWMNQDKLVFLLGGDHSTPLGYIKALAEKHGSFGILQIDAHADLRKAYEDFKYSHASIMYNALKVKGVERLVQVGIRDYCQEEVDVMNAESQRVQVFFDRDLKQERFKGKTWAQQVDEIVSALPQKVYLSFDIDGLDPKLCPNTGTPVAGGFETDEVLYLVEAVVASGRTLIGGDLNEVAPGENDEWDANVAARLLYRLCNLLGHSNGKI